MDIYAVYTVSDEVKLWHVADSYPSAVEWVDNFLDKHHDELLEKAIEEVVHGYNYFDRYGSIGDPEDCTESIAFEFDMYREEFHIGQVWE